VVVRFFPLLLLSLLLPLPALAADASPYFTERLEQVLGFDDFDYDSDWVPGGSPIQVRLTAHAGNTIYVGMDGDALWSWEQGAFSVDGAVDGGDFEIDIGLNIEAQVRFDILGYTWEGDLMDPFGYGVFETALYDPYLLPGHPDRPAVIDADLPRETLADVPLGIDLIIASGTLHIEIGGHVHAELTGESVLLEADQESALLVEHEGWAPMAADPEVELTGQATLSTHLTADVLFLLYPSVVITLLGTDYTLAEFEVPVELPPVDADWVFDPVDVAFPAAPPDLGDDDDDDDGIEGEAGEGGGGRYSSAGCRCTSAATGHGGLALLGLIGGLAGWRWRRTNRR
jgi:MYXO-CTERM domain-containing protein